MQLRDLEMERRDPKTVVAVILGGGAGTRLFPLTKRRAKPAVSLFLLLTHINASFNHDHRVFLQILKAYRLFLLKMLLEYI